MPLLKKWKSRGAIWGIWHVKETVDELKSMLAEYQFIEEDLSGYKSESRRMEYLAVRVLLKEVTGSCARILHMPSGRPYLEDGGMKISISHTKGYVAVGLHPDSDLGIDIEYYSERVAKVSSRFVRDDEMEYISENVPSDAIQDKNFIYRLLLIWSGKETLYKIIDSPEVDFREHLRIYPFRFDVNDTFLNGGYGIMKAKEYKSDIQSEFLIDFIVHEDFVFTYSVAD